jgi:hypothetical protein
MEEFNKKSPAHPKPSVQSMPKDSISLSSLNQKDTKKPTKEGLIGLKEALSNVISNKKPEVSKPADKQNNEIVKQNVDKTFTPKREDRQEVKKEIKKETKEVPEDILRKVLSLDEK